MKRLDPARDFTVLLNRNQVFMGSRTKMRHINLKDEIYHEINEATIIDQSSLGIMLNYAVHWMSYFGYYAHYEAYRYSL